MTRTLAQSTLVTFLFASGAAFAQEGTYQEGFHPKMGLAMLSWEVAAPVGSLHDWEGNVTPSGGEFEVRSCVAKQLSVGAATTWNWFNQNINSLTETQGNVTFTGPIYRRMNSFSLRATGHYYFTENAFQPYAGVPAVHQRGTLDQRLLVWARSRDRCPLPGVPRPGAGLDGPLPVDDGQVLHGQRRGVVRVPDWPRVDVLIAGSPCSER
jgi:hypothetical protein